jgi:hypothetical protein
MKIIRLEKPPTKWDADESASLSEYDLKPLQEFGVSVFSYWYVDHGYEGSGKAVVYWNDGWWTFDLGHCSCYGPTEDWETRKQGPHATLAALLQNCSAEARAELRPLADLISLTTEGEGYVAQ